MEAPRRSRMENAAAVAEIVGAVAVVISLIYVGSEIRQNTIVLQQSNHQSALTLGHEWDAWMLNPDFADAYIVANEDPSLLTDRQRTQVQTWIGEGFNIWEFVFASRGTDLVTDENFDAWERFFAGELRENEIWRLTWPQIRDAYAESFQVYVDEVAGL